MRERGVEGGSEGGREVEGGRERSPATVDKGVCSWTQCPPHQQ